MLHSIHYLIYPGSIISDLGGRFNLIEYLKSTL